MVMEVEEDLYQLKFLVEALTTSGKDKLDEEALKKVKKICRKSDSYVQELYKILNKQLKKRHAEIRFSAFLICDEIFQKSHCFRELLLKDFKQITNLLLGFDKKNPLPKPYPVARKLKQKCVEAFQKWYDNYGEGYLTLRLGYKYLRDCKKVDFAELTARSEAQRQRDAEERQRQDDIKRRRIQKITEELQAQTPEIKSTLKQLQNCFRLLIPDVHNFFIPLNDIENDSPSSEELQGLEDVVEVDEDSEYGNESLRSHGIMKGMSVTIDMSEVKKVRETSDNEIIVQNLREFIATLTSKVLPQVKKWEETMRPYGEGNGLLIKQIVDLKSMVMKSVNLYNNVEIVPQDKSKLSSVKLPEDCDSDEDDDDFIEVSSHNSTVGIEGISEALILGISGPSWRKDDEYFDSDPLNRPSTSQASVSQGSFKEFENSKKTKKKSIDKCPDAALNGMEHKPLRHHNPLAGLSQVWTAAPDLHEQDEMDSTGGILGVATQRVNYELEWEPVKWTCRAPLATGRLCPRKDREKCPLHGKIIPRDELGQPISAEDAARVKAAQEQYERDHPAWQDPNLLAEIKAATGVDLKMPKGKYKRKRKYENLTDIKKTTPYERLARKVLSKKAVRRVNKALNKQEASGGWSTNFNGS